MIISVVMVFSLIPTAVFAIQVDEWVTGQGYGSITPNSDGTYTVQGDSELNTDNSHSGGPIPKQMLQVWQMEK
ncbi:MAG: hypothetical protein ACLTE2_13470 [Eubacteriales bacterium]